MGIEEERLSLEWASAAEAVRFVDLVTGFTKKIRDMGPLKPNESQILKMKAARPALESSALRMALARQVRTVRKEKPLPTLPSDQEIVEGLDKVWSREFGANELLLHLQEAPLTVEECATRLSRTQEEVVEIFSRLKKKKLVEPDRLVVPDA